MDYSSGCFPETMEETEMNMERPSHAHYAVPVPFLALSSRASRVASIRTVRSAAVGKIDVIFVLCQLPRAVCDIRCLGERKVSDRPPWL